MKKRKVKISTDRKLSFEDVKTGPVKSSHLLSTLVVRQAARDRALGMRISGHLKAGAITIPCSLGATGIKTRKREGDKATPAGPMAIRHGYFRPDRMHRPQCRIPLRPNRPTLGWCDAPESPLYNRPVALPMAASHEAMWRNDGLYDVVFVLNFNLAPRRIGLGSAIFFHCARPDLRPTLGCVALRAADMRRLLPRLARGAVVQVVG